jgi:PAS domain S-box-containing protein/putative nucleotidyltransferase with HDIG domain
LNISEKYNRNLIESSPDPFVAIGTNGIITDVNTAAENATGIPREKLIGSVFSEYLTEPEKAVAGFQQVLREGKVFNVELNLKHSSGYTTPVLYNASLYKDDEGKIVGVITISRDISAIRKYENELIHLRNHIEQIAEQKAKELVIANKELIFHKIEKADRAAELLIANRELAFQNQEKDKRASELANANKELLLQIIMRKNSEEELMQQKEYLEISNKKIAHLLKQSINVISKIGELRDVYTAGHQNKVAELAIAIAREMELPDETIQNISYGALIHDIGKIYIPSDILNKPGKISNLEYQILQTHVERSYDVVKEIDFSPQIPTMIYQHHERLDGSGYPLGLTSDQIIIESRILAVADVVEAMSAHRPYRASLGIDAALVEISTNKGSKFDSDVVDICIKLFREQGFAFTCKLI